jgi:WD40 repeat protein
VRQRSRLRVLVAVFLAIDIVIAGAAGVVAFRATRPSRTLKVSFGFEPGSYSGLASAFDGPELRFVGPRRLAVNNPGHSCDVYSVETGTRERTLPDFPEALDPCSSRALAFSGQGGSLELVNLATGTTRPVAGVTGRPFALSPTADVVAALTSSETAIELRSIGDGRVRTLPLPVAPQNSNEVPWTSLTFSPDGERLAFTSALRIWTCHLATGSWENAGVGSLLGFSRGSLVMVPDSASGPRGLTLVGPGGRSRNLAPEDHGDALSASGERLATLHWTGDTGAEIVVREIETGEVLRKITTSRDVRCLALSPQGERLAVAHAGGLVEIWEIP